MNKKLKLIIYTIMISTLIGCGTNHHRGEGDSSSQGSSSLDYKQRFLNSTSCDQVLDKEFLYICYNYNLKVATAVAYTLYGDLVNELNIKKRPDFYEEGSIATSYRAKLGDYRGSGYDRGHMAPDAAFDWSQESLDSTYSLANIIPQIPDVNQKAWVKVEKYARDKAVELSELNIVNLIDYSTTPELIGKGEVAVSIGYYKILYNTDKSYQECYYYANDTNYDFENDTIMEHRIDCDTI